MAQFLRPSSTATATAFTGGHADIDESVASDADRAFSTDGSDAELEVLLSPATDPQVGTGHVIRYRAAKTDDGVLSGTGNAKTLEVRLMQGATQVAADTSRTLTGAYQTFTWTLTGTQADAITNYADLRLEFVSLGGGGNPTNRRGVAISWAEMEVPDAPPELEQHSSGSSLAAAATITEGRSTTRSAASALSAGAAITGGRSTARSAVSSLQAAASIAEGRSTARSVASSLQVSADIEQLASAVEDDPDPEIHSATSALAAVASVAGSASTVRAPSSSLAAARATVTGSTSSARLAPSALAATAGIASGSSSSRSAASALAAAAGLVSAIGSTERSPESSLLAAGAIATATSVEGGPENHVAPSRLSAGVSIIAAIGTARSQPSAARAVASVTGAAATERSQPSAARAAAAITTTRETHRTAASALAVAARVIQDTDVEGHLPARIAARVALWARHKASVADVAEVAPAAGLGNMLVISEDRIMRIVNGVVTTRRRRRRQW